MVKRWLEWLLAWIRASVLIIVTCVTSLHGDPLRRRVNVRPEQGLRARRLVVLLPRSVKLD